MPLYTGVNGANREIKKMFTGVSGTNRELKEMYTGVNGTNRKVFSSSLGLFKDGVLYRPVTPIESEGATNGAEIHNFHTNFITVDNYKGFELYLQYINNTGTGYNQGYGYATAVSQAEMTATKTVRLTLYNRASSSRTANINISVSSDSTAIVTNYKVWQYRVTISGQQVTTVDLDVSRTPNNSTSLNADPLSFRVSCSDSVRQLYLLGVELLP